MKTSSNGEHTYLASTAPSRMPAHIIGHPNGLMTSVDEGADLGGHQVTYDDHRRRGTDEASHNDAIR